MSCFVAETRLRQCGHRIVRKAYHNTAEFVCSARHYQCRCSSTAHSSIEFRCSCEFMPVKSLSSQSLIDRVQALEDRSDRCFEPLELLHKNSWNVGTWASLVKAAEQLEGIP